MPSVYESQPGYSEKLGGDRPTITVPWVVIDTTDEAIARALLAAAAPTTLGDYYRAEISLDHQGYDTWEARVTYTLEKAPEIGDFKWEFDTTGGSSKITQAKANVANYAAAGTAPDFKGAIGVTDDGVDGVDIVTPAFKWNETHQLDASAVDFSFALTLESLTGKTNDASFRGFSANRVLFLGARGSQSSKTPGIVEITFSFAAGHDLTNENVGGITVSAKKAWDYLWVRYSKVNDGTANRLTRRPTSAHVDRVYDSGDFSQLGIGTA